MKKTLGLLLMGVLPLAANARENFSCGSITNYVPFKVYVENVNGIETSTLHKHLAKDLFDEANTTTYDVCDQGSSIYVVRLEQGGETTDFRKNPQVLNLGGEDFTLFDINSSHPEYAAAYRTTRETVDRFRSGVEMYSKPAKD